MTDGETTWSYKYNADGLRTEKTNGTTTYKYVYSGSTLVQMQINSNVLSFGYDGSAPTTVTYGGNTYYYVTNLQGDIVSILDGNRTEVVKYTYDAWGNILSTTGTLADTLGQINPLRYRGYVYDQECDLYYLQSRYYDPSIGRFLNADGYASTGQGILGNNMFAYCNNNPVNRIDPTGCFWEELLQELQNTISEAASYFALSVGVSQADTVAVGPADAAAALMIIGGLLYYGGKATYKTLTSLISASSSGIGKKATEGPKTTEDDLSGIASAYDVFACEAAANSMAKYLRKNGKRAEILTIHFIGGRGYIVSDMTDMVISENGIHIGVLYGGKVYCNVHPYGLPEVTWISDFYGTGTKNVLRTPI